jgi:hypothetical protein
MEAAESLYARDPEAVKVDLSGLNISSLESVLEVLGRFEELQELDLTRNLLTSLPDDLSSLSHLRVLGLKDNPFEGVEVILTSLQSLDSLEELTVDLMVESDKDLLQLELPQLVKLNGEKLVFDFGESTSHQQDEQGSEDQVKTEEVKVTEVEVKTEVKGTEVVHEEVKAEVKRTEVVHEEVKEPEVVNEQVKTEVKEPEVVNEQVKTEVKESEVQEDEVKEAEVKNPEIKEVEVKDPEVKDPEIKDPEVKESEVKEFEVKIEVHESESKEEAKGVDVESKTEVLSPIDLSLKSPDTVQPKACSEPRDETTVLTTEAPALTVPVAASQSSDPPAQSPSPGANTEELPAQTTGTLGVTEAFTVTNPAAAKEEVKVAEPPVVNHDFSLLQLLPLSDSERALVEEAFMSAQLDDASFEELTCNIEFLQSKHNASLEAGQFDQQDLKIKFELKHLALSYLVSAKSASATTELKLLEALAEHFYTASSQAAQPSPIKSEHLSINTETAELLEDLERLERENYALKQDKEAVRSDFEMEKHELHAEIESLQQENRKYLDTIIKHSKANADNTLSKTTSQFVDSPQRSMQSVSSSRSVKALTLKQLKDAIDEIYSSKAKFDERCVESRQPRETLEQHMYNFLNQKYGLKRLTVDWASAIQAGVQRYAGDDNDIGVFGKVLKNQCDEEFRHVQQQVKDTIAELLKVQLT